MIAEHTEPATNDSDAAADQAAKLAEAHAAAAAIARTAAVAGVSWLALAIAGMPLAWWALGAAGRGDLKVPSLVMGAIVIGASLASLLPLYATRYAEPMVREVSGRLMHVAMRLFLTAGGLVFYLVLLPETQRLAAGSIALGWYAASWAIELISLAPKRPRPPRQPAA